MVADGRYGTGELGVAMESRFLRSGGGGGGLRVEFIVVFFVIVGMDGFVVHGGC